MSFHKGFKTIIHQIIMDISSFQRGRTKIRNNVTSA